MSHTAISITNSANVVVWRTLYCRQFYLYKKKSCSSETKEKSTGRLHQTKYMYKVFINTADV